MKAAIYLWSLAPVTALAVEALAAPNEHDSLIAIVLQWGLGAIVGLVAVRMMLVLYKDKEQGVREYHGQLLDLTREQISAIKDTKTALEKVDSALELHNKEFVRFLDVFLAASVVHLNFFASKGPRYTAADGERDRQERITSDLALAARIDELHNLLAERE